VSSLAEPRQIRAEAAVLAGACARGIAT